MVVRIKKIYPALKHAGYAATALLPGALFLSTCVTTICSARTGAPAIANPEASSSASPKVFST